ncbi:MAG: Trk system potassium transporter TrkA [Candidatus Eisenbacteria bacterium]|nr:Trk system potassium transporter TrkA [Candidatus Latescibacterota bacterium]MBD3301167.1 Trk system potassium transporter TrkA [Candidatus Eisenbacteria bacterium]
MNILILGAGEVGFHLTKKLSADKYNITIVESDPAKAQMADDQLDAHVVRGSASSYATLKQADIEHCDIFAALTNDEEANLLACQIARKLEIPHKIARVRNPEFGSPGHILTLEEMGVDMLIHPEKETANAIVRLIHRSGATDVVEFAGGTIQLLGIRIERDSPIARKPLKEFWAEYGNLPARIVAISRKEKTLIPSGEDHVAPGDQVFIVAEQDLIPTVIEIMGKADVRIRNIMILGGGLIGQLVARALQDSMHMKLIESRADRSEEIADLLQSTLVIHGDGTDMDLLAVEGIIDMDAFIAVTGDDETNIISTLMARHLRVPRTIALVNKVEYLPITPTIGMDAVVSKKLLTVNAILHSIKHRRVESVATIPGIEAEIIEIVAGKHSVITRKKLRNTKFPRSAILGAVRRENDVIIPTGETQIRPGDRVVIFSLPRALGEVEKLFK